MFLSQAMIQLYLTPIPDFPHYVDIPSECHKYIAHMSLLPLKSANAFEILPSCCKTARGFSPFRGRTPAAPSFSTRSLSAEVRNPFLFVFTFVVQHCSTSVFLRSLRLQLAPSVFGLLFSFPVLVSNTYFFRVPHEDPLRDNIQASLLSQFHTNVPELFYGIPPKLVLC